MDSFKNICEFINGITPEMIAQKETASTTPPDKDVVETVSIPSFLDDALFEQRLKEAEALFLRRRA
jgi:hypothetical protein|nr:MAG TPA: hypothetical protein [Caudoviricetes sp.]